MPHGVSALESHTGYWLRLVSNHVSHAFRLRIEECGVTVAEWVVLRALYDVSELHPSQLADTLGLTRGAVSKLVDRLTSKELTSCRVEKSDRRYQVVCLTESGRELVPTLAALADQNDREFFDDLTEKEQRELRSLLQGIAMRRQLHAIPVE